MNANFKVDKLVYWGKSLVSYSIYNGEAGARVLLLGNIFWVCFLISVYQKYLGMPGYEEISFVSNNQLVDMVNYVIIL